MQGVIDILTFYEFVFDFFVNIAYNIPWKNMWAILP